MRLSFYSVPLSINSAYYLKGNGKVRTKESREWGDNILTQLQQYLEQMDEFKSTYDPTVHGICVEIEHKIPARYFYNIEGLVSSRSADLSNIEKLLIDCIFDKRFNGRFAGGKKVRNLDINDKCIIKLISTKVPDSIFQINMVITTTPLVRYVEPEDGGELSEKA